MLPWFMYNYATLGRITLSPAGGIGRGLWEGSWQATWSGRLQNELTHLADDIDDRAELDRRVEAIAAREHLPAGPMLEYVHQWEDIRRIWTEPVDSYERAQTRVRADQEYLRVAIQNIRRDPLSHHVKRLARGVFVLWAGEIPFRYSEINQLPRIVDCYAMNVVNAEEVWLSYYSDFPLVSIKNFQLNRAWKDFGCMNPAFAIAGETVIFQKCYTRREGKSQLLRCSISASAQTEPVYAVDEEGAVVDGLFTAVARGPNFYLLTESALYELQRNR